ncbi:MAG: hypothetical protein HYY25_06780 [Candidatus Wallbacteria bacterium]|nr:hypothetical protein [Candidatus Wallbacteria bacterium]
MTKGNLSTCDGPGLTGSGAEAAPTACGLRRALAPSVPAIVFISCFLFVLSTGPSYMFGDGDTGWHLATGRRIVTSGELPRADSYSWSAAGTPWVAFEWLTDVVYYQLYQWRGYLALLVLDAASIALAYSLVAQAALTAGSERVSTLALTGWAFYLSSIHWFVRPHVRTWVFLALWSWLLLRRWRHEDRWIWVIPASMTLWVNLHGGWPAGLILLALFGVADLAAASVAAEDARGRAFAEARRWGALVAITAAATLLNPYGPGLHADMLEQVTAAPVQNITQEWQSPDFRGAARPFRPFILAVLASLAFLSGREKILGWALGLTGLYMVFESVRHLTVFLLWMTPILLLGVKGAMDSCFGRGAACGRSGAGGGAGGWALCLCVVAAALAGVFPAALRSTPAGFGVGQFPVEAVEYLRTHKPEGRMLNEYGWGGYVIWELGDGYPVFIDGRNIMYGRKITEDSLTFQFTAGGWEELLQRYRIDWTLYPTGSRLTRALKARGWRVLHEDPTATVLARP